TTHVAVQSALTIIALFFLLADGDRLVGWLERVVPLEPGQLREMLGELRRTGGAVIFATAATAAIQAVVAFIGYLAGGVPHAALFGLVTLLVTLLPLLGGAIT